MSFIWWFMSLSCNHKKKKSISSTRAEKATRPERHDVISAQLTVADPGISINPDLNAQQDLIKRAYAQHVKEEADHAAIIARFHPKRARDIEKNGEENENKENDEEQEDEDRPIGTRVISERRLTQAQRNKKLRKIALTEELKRKRMQKNLKKQIHILPQVLKDLQEEAKVKTHEKEKIKELKKNPNKPIRLGPNLIEKEFPEVLLPDEVQGGHFRNVQPSGRLVLDQFKRFQERNLIEPRKKNNYTRKYKLIRYERFKEKNNVLGDKK